MGAVLDRPPDDRRAHHVDQAVAVAQGDVGEGRHAAGGLVLLAPYLAQMIAVAAGAAADLPVRSGAAGAAAGGAGGGVEHRADGAALQPQIVEGALAGAGAEELDVLDRAEGVAAFGAGALRLSGPTTLRRRGRGSASGVLRAGV